MVKASRNKLGTWDSNPFMSEEQATVSSCAACGKTFSDPIELNVRAEGSIETYFACPHCFSRLNDSANLKKRLSEALLRASAEDAKEPVKDTQGDKPAGCVHSLGYLKTRPKGSPIPDECLTCVSIMKCMGFGGR